MKNELLQHKGYLGSYKISVEDDLFHGKVEFIKDLVTYEAKDAKGLKKAFVRAVEDYLNTCKQMGVEPQKPFKGSLNIRIGEDLHRKIALSLKEGESINSFIKNSLEKAVS